MAKPSRERKIIHSATEPPEPAEPLVLTKELALALIEKSLAGFSMEEVIDSEYLELLSHSTGGFTFAADRKLALQSLIEGRFRTGYTNLQTRCIYFNPLFFAGCPELGLPAQPKEKIRGFIIHEVGHHVPEVVWLQDKISAYLEQIEVPEEIKGDMMKCHRFYQIVQSNINNGVYDVWDEAYMGRKPYTMFSEDLDIRGIESKPSNWHDLSAPEQFIQAFLTMRYHQITPAMVSPEVWEQLELIKSTKALKVLMDSSYFSPPRRAFMSEAQLRAQIQHKFEAYRQVFLPAWLKLFNLELEKEKEGKQAEKKEQGNDPELTSEEIEEIIEKLLQALEGAGKKLESSTPAEGEKEGLEKMISKIIEKLTGSEKPETAPDASPEELQGMDAVNAMRKQFLKGQQDRENQEMGKKHGVDPEVIRKWKRISEKYKEVISSTAAELAEFFIDDRRKYIEYNRREGDITPGLEYDTIAAMSSGDADPETRMSYGQAQEFYSTEIEFIVDTSGSMSGEKIERTKELLIILTEAFQQVKNDLLAENLLRPEDEEPLQIGVTKFDTSAEIVTPRSESLSEKKEIKILSNLDAIGGGTDERMALQETYKNLTLKRSRVIKIIVMLTDGQGAGSGVHPIIRQIERDDEIVFLALGLGDDDSSAQAIVDTYLAPLKNRKDGNVFGKAVSQPKNILPYVVAFLREQITKRREL